MSTMTPRQRMITAIKNEKPDHVPVAPDISNMIPCRLTGKPFWNVYYLKEPPLWQAYIDAVKYFGIDGWFTYGDMQYQWPGERYEAIEDMAKTSERWVVRTRGRLNGRPYRQEMTYYIADSPTVTKKVIEDIEGQWDLIKDWYAPPVGYNPSLLNYQRKSLGELGVLGVSVGSPGFQSWFGMVEGGVETLTYLYYDRHDIVEEWRALHEHQLVRQMEMVLEQRPDFVLLGGSGTITLQSPVIARELALPTLKKLTRMAREAGVLTMIHSCGKERDLVKWCAEETDLNCINPLEVPPMGDCDLAEMKRLYGGKLSLMGNLNTTDVMLLGSPADVERTARAAIDAAGAGGGFILSTGDQCGRDTPDANIRKLVEVAQTYGVYA